MTVAELVALEHDDVVDGMSFAIKQAERAADERIREAARLMQGYHGGLIKRNALVTFAKASGWEPVLARLCVMSRSIKHTSQNVIMGATVGISTTWVDEHIKGLSDQAGREFLAMCNAIGVFSPYA